MRRASWGIVLCFTVQLAAQEPARENAFGIVRNEAGKPWANATVQLVHRAHPGVMHEDYADTVVATTDQRGRFRVQLLVGMPYTVWAHGDIEDGSYRCTKALQNIVPGVPMILAETPRRYLRRFSFDLHESWQKPMRVFAWTRRPHMQAELQPDEHGVYTPPLWPAEYVGASLREGSREVYSGFLVNTEARARRSAIVPGGEKPDANTDVVPLLKQTAVLEVAARHSNVVKIVDAAGKPVAGVEVRAESFPPRRVVGTTDANGDLEIVSSKTGFAGIPYRSVVLPPDGSEAALEQDEVEKAGDDKPYTLALRAGQAVRGKLLLGEEAVLGNAPIVLQSSIGTGRSTWFGVDPRVFWSDADGSFAIPGRSTYPYRLSLVLNAKQRAELARDDGAPPVWPLALIAPERKGQPKDVGEVRVDRLRALDIRVRPPEGVPPSSVRMVVARMIEPWSNGPHEPDVVRTDRRGRTRLLTAGCDRLLVHAATKQGAAWAIVSDNDRKLELRLNPAHTVRFRVVDNDGKPLAGARVGLVAPEQDRRGDAELQAVHSIVSDWCMVHAVSFKSGTTDENGHVDLVMPLVDARMDLSVSKGRERSKRIIIEFAEQREPGPIVLTLN